MPTASNIIITDDQAVVHTFEPVKIGPNQQVLKNRSAITTAGQETIVLSAVPATSASNISRANASLSVPVEVTSTDTGRTTVDDTARFFCNSIVPDNMTSAERETFAYMAGQLVINTIIQGYISDSDVMS